MLKYVIPVLLIFVGLTEGALESSEGRKLILMKTGGFFVTFLTQILIWTAMYMAYTDVGTDTIRGVQGRYMIVLVWPFMMLLYNRKIHLHLRESVYNRIIIGTTALITLTAVFMIWYYTKCYIMI